MDKKRSRKQGLRDLELVKTNREAKFTPAFYRVDKFKKYISRVHVWSRGKK